MCATWIHPTPLRILPSSIHTQLQEDYWIIIYMYGSKMYTPDWLAMRGQQYICWPLMRSPSFRRENACVCVFVSSIINIVYRIACTTHLNKKKRISLYIKHFSWFLAPATSFSEHKAAAVAATSLPLEACNDAHRTRAPAYMHAPYVHPVRMFLFRFAWLFRMLHNNEYVRGSVGGQAKQYSLYINL